MMRGTPKSGQPGAAPFIVSRQSLDNFKPRFERVLAVLLLALSALLSVTAFSSGAGALPTASVWEQLTANVTLAGAISGVLIQVIITAFEWTYAAERNRKYWAALIVDVLLTFAGAWKVVAPPARQWMATTFDADPFGFGTAFFAGAVILVGAYGLAYLPEATLVER